MGKKYKSIFRALMLSVLISIMIPILIMGVSMYSISQKTIKTKVDKSIEGTIEQVNINISNKLKDLRNTANYYATHKHLKNLLQQEISLNTVLEVDEIISNFMIGTNKVNEQITIGGNNKQIFINWGSDGRIIEEDLAGRLRQMDWYKKALENDNKELWITNMDSINKYIKQEKYISMVKIIDKYNRDEDNIGFVVVSIPEDSISNLFNIGIKDSRLTGYVVDEEGRLISHTDNSRLDEQLLDKGMVNQINQVVRGCIVGELEGVKQVIYYQRIPNTGWTTIFTMPYKYYNEEGRQIIKLIGYIIMGSTFLGIIISTMCSRSILRPVRQLIQGMKEVSEGNLDYQVSIKKNNEI